MEYIQSTAMRTATTKGRTRMRKILAALVTLDLPRKHLGDDFPARPGEIRLRDFVEDSHPQV